MSTRYLLAQAPLPLGYHRLHLRLDDLRLESLLISAPLQAYVPVCSDGKRWGVFCPVYALNSAHNWGAGDFSDLAAFADFIRSLNGDAVATLPLLASFLDEPFNPSPYAPVSRLFWNEFYLDVTKIAEFSRCRSAQALAGSGEFQSRLERRARPFADRLSKHHGAQARRVRRAAKISLDEKVETPD